MKDILLAMRFAYRHTIGSGRSGFFGMLVQGVEVMEVSSEDLVLYGLIVVVTFVVGLTYAGEWLRLALN